MHYVFGPVAFESPARLRDDTAYIYAAPDESGSLRVTPVAGAHDVQGELEKAKAAVDEFFGPLVIYAAPTRVPTAAGASAPAYEGEVTDPGTRAPRRFGLTALAGQTGVYTFLLFGPRRGLVQDLERLVRSVRFQGPASNVGALAADGMARRQAAEASFEVPDDWSYPTTLLFGDPKDEDLQLRLTLDEPLVGEGVISLEAEAPAVDGDRLVVLKQHVDPLATKGPGWTGEWLVEHKSPLGTQTLAIRKASIALPDQAALTVYGKALQKNDGLLAAGWDGILRTVRAGGA
jgi:hypothetical protein